MEKLFDIQNVIISSIEKLPFYERQLFSRFSFQPRICGIVGPRGVGKTTLLLKQAILNGAKEHRALYVSADNIFFLKNRLLDLVDQLYKETDVRLLCIDEIHKYPEWNQELKNIYDTYHDVKIIFTGSSTIDLVKSKFDLSRRVILYHLHGLSFREYLEFYLKFQLPVISLNDLIENSQKISQELDIPHILKHFKHYLKTGYYLYFNEIIDEQEKFQTIENTIKKTIYEDIAVSHSLKTPTLLLMEKLFKFVINSSPGELNAYKLSSNLGKDFDSISEYLSLLEQAGLIRFLYSKKSGMASLRNPTKMYPDNTNMIHSAYVPLLEESSKGKIRETFVLNQLQNAGLKVYYSDKGDFCVDETTFEVGGKNKTPEQIKDLKNASILADDIEIGFQKRIPLFLAGFLY